MGDPELNEELGPSHHDSTFSDPEGGLKDRPLSTCTANKIIHMEKKTGWGDSLLDP